MEEPDPRWTVQAGQNVTVSGFRISGRPSPRISRTEMRLRPGTSWPRAVPASISDALSGRLQYRLVEMTGVIHRESIEDDGRVALTLQSRGIPVKVRISQYWDLDLKSLVDSSARVKGVLDTKFDAAGKAAAIQLWVYDSRDLVILRAAPAVSKVPQWTVAGLLGTPRKHLPENRVSLSGIVQAVQPGGAMTLRDGTGNIPIQRSQIYSTFKSGPYQVLGFVRAAGSGIELQDTNFIDLSHDKETLRQPLSEVRAVRMLQNSAAAREQPVHLRGVVTYYDSVDQLLFVQDATGGIHIQSNLLKAPLPLAGSEIELDGVTSEGEFAPVVRALQLRLVRKGKIPEPVKASFEDLLKGRQDSQWVSVEGVVRNVGKTDGHAFLDMTYGTHHFRSEILGVPELPETLVNSIVRVEGVCGTRFNFEHQVLGIFILSPSPSSLRVIEARPPGGRLTDINQLLSFSLDRNSEGAVRVRGIVTLAAPEGPSYVQDDSGGVLVRNHKASSARLGDVVDVTGFAELGEFTPEIYDATLRDTRKTGSVSPALVTADQILEEGHDAELVQIDAWVLDDSLGQDFLLNAHGVMFHARLLNSKAPLPSYGRGSLVRLIGVCAIKAKQSGAVVRPADFTILLRTPGDFALLRPAPWWTLRRVISLAAVLLGAILLVLIWVFILRHRVRRQTAVISQKLREEEELKNAAEQASRSKSAFLANMSHEIRTPLNGVIGFTDLLLGTSITAEQTEYLNTVRFSAHSLLQILNDVLDFSKIEAGKLELESAEFSVADCVRQAMRVISPDALHKGLKTHFAIGDQVPRRVVGDCLRLRQVLLNFLSNAIKFTHSGSISLAVDYLGEEEDRVVLEFCVADTGIGIPDDVQGTIFEAFQQADGSVTRKYGGTGLGLAISSRLISSLGGRVWLESQPGQGSRFHSTAKLEKASIQDEVPVSDSAEDLRTASS